MLKRSNEPFLWMLFSAGGVVSAVLLPIHIVLFFLLFPFGWLNGPSYDRLLAILSHPAARLYLLAICSLPLFHWAHRFRFTLYDGLQIKHLDGLINFFCYGGAILGTCLAVYFVWNIP